jgi:uncharacterized protein (DUF849 family)
MNRNVIISCAVTGAADTVGKHPAIPVTPKQIAAAAIEAAQAGAAIAHIHVRDPDTGAISHDTALFREVVERVREADTDVVLNLTAGGGGDWVPSTDDPAVGGPGTDLQTPEQRHDPVAALGPELCTLDCGSYNTGEIVYVNPMDWLRRHARLIQAQDVKPELECFELGHVRLARQLIDEGLIDTPALFQLCLGIPWAAEATPETLMTMRNHLPADAHWAAFGIGRMQMPIVAQSVLMGGHVRVGLEDNLYLEKGVFASNGQLVEKAAHIVTQLGANVLGPSQAREHLGLNALTGAH